ncbi:hypothetical protein JG677_03090 [Campylobacter sp. TTU-622]|uniref:hypothetical protein n=1 Tax=Campylobacter sp. TTU-622 TaxID=2800583 RepID=UPI001907325D|nr:hypothetical protein [Campylobacter sp. TTU-622]MBK1973037.1 hypothetical protein [Campylobacter sp. TTU-622]
MNTKILENMFETLMAGNQSIINLSGRKLCLKYDDLFDPFVIMMELLISLIV